MDNLTGSQTQRFVIKLTEMREHILKNVQEYPTTEETFMNDIVTKVDDYLKKLSERDTHQNIIAYDKITVEIIKRLKEDLNFVLETRHVRANIGLKLSLKEYRETLTTMLKQMYEERTRKLSVSEKEKLDLDEETTLDTARSPDTDEENTDGKCPDTPGAFYDIGMGVRLHAESDISNIIHAIRWESDDFESFNKEDTMLKNYKFETDFFKIEAKDPNDKDNFPKDSSGMITVMAELSNDINYQFLQLKAYIKDGQTWKFVEASLKDKSVTFQTVKVDAFCIVSNPIKVQVPISPDGCKYVAKTDRRIQIDFPPGTVEKEDSICLHFVPVDKQILRRKYEERSKNGESILAISDCLCTTGDKPLNKKVKITLPLNDVRNHNETDEDYVCRLFRESTNGELILTDNVVEMEENNTAVFETDNISRISVSLIGKEELKKGSQLISESIEEVHGFKFICKVVFFVSHVTTFGLDVLLACIEKSKMQAFRQSCEEKGFHLYNTWTSQDFAFKPHIKINITLKGCFSLPRFATRRRLDLTFWPYPLEKFTRFKVEIKPKIDQDVHGILLLTKDGKFLDEIMFDTQSIKEYTPGTSSKGRKQPDPKKAQPVKKTGSRAKSFVNRKATLPVCQFSDDDFLTEKGILSVSKVINAEKMFETVLYLDMKRVQIDQICEKIPNSSRQSYTLLQTALDQQTHNKLDKLISALESADEGGLAESIRHMYIERQDLSQINK